MPSTGKRATNADRSVCKAKVVDKSYEKPYAGLKVVDASLGIAGPHCGMLLALYGADVVKIEPLFGDWVRPLGTTYGDHSALSIAYGRGKRSLALNLKSTDGIAIARRLAELAGTAVLPSRGPAGSFSRFRSLI